MDLTAAIARARDWIGARIETELTGATLTVAAVELLVVLVAFLLARLVRRLAERWTGGWFGGVGGRFRAGWIMAAARQLVLPALWWLLLVVATRIAWMLGFPAPVLSVATTLVAVWLVIRAAATLVRDPLLSRAIAIVAWTIAALDILGLLDVVSAALDSAALQLGALRISLLTVIKGALLLTVLLWVATVAAGAVRLHVARVHGLSASAQVLIANLVRIALVVVAILVALNTVGIDLTALALFSGAVGLGLGFGLQKIVSNLISGVILLVDKSIKPGDTIEVGQTFGWITSLKSRYVSVRARDGKEYLIPNEDLITNQVVNWTYSSRQVRLDIPFGVGYGSDLHLVRNLAVAAAATPPRVLKDPAPVCHVTGFGDSAIELLLRFWIDDPFNGVTNIKGEVLLKLWESFRENGVEIPFPQREVRLRAAPRLNAAD